MKDFSGIDQGECVFRKGIYRLIEITLQSDVPTHFLYKSTLLAICLTLIVVKP